MAMVKVHWAPQSFLSELNKTNEKLVRRIAHKITRRAKEICREKNIVITGNLRRSLRPVVSLGKGKAQVVAGGDTGSAPGVGAPVDYASFVELGTRKQAAKPYLRPAVEQFSQEDFNDCVNSLKGD